MDKSKKSYIKKGERFNKLIVLERAKLSVDKILCRCDCGNEKRIIAEKVKGGRTKSCGCLIREKATKHGLSHHPLYKKIQGIIQRCHNENNTNCKYYKERGIIVCEEYKNNPEKFVKDSIELGWKPGLEPDRIDNDGIYIKDNIRYVTKKENNRNKRNNHLLTAFGETKTLVEWSEDDRCVVCYGTLSTRINKLKWNPKEAITTPSQKKK